MDRRIAWMLLLAASCWACADGSVAPGEVATPDGAGGAEDVGAAPPDAGVEGSGDPSDATAGPEDGEEHDLTPVDATPVDALVPQADTVNTDAATPVADGSGADAGATDADLDVQWTDVFAEDATTEPPRPSPVTIHRLNRAEYNNTVRDLLGTARTPADDFPDDDHGYGFDNNSDVLTTTPTHVELYLSAAEQLMAEVFFRPMVEPETYTVVASVAGGTSGRDDGDNGWLLWSNGHVSETVTFARGGRYRWTVLASGQSAAGVDARMQLRVNEVAIQTFDVPAPVGVLGTYEVEFELAAGTHDVSAAFINDFYDAANGQDRNLWVHSFTLQGPLGVEGEPNPQRERWITCDLEGDDAATCASGILRRFATRAWRRPLDGDGWSRLEALFDTRLDAGDSAEEALRTSMTAVMVSPRFVFRAEGDAEGFAAVERPLDDWELASRLSYFLWSSMPDDELFELAEAGDLQDPVVLEEQVRRMLADPRSEALVQNFAGQWLYIRAIDSAQPDTDAFPEFDEVLRNAMVGEMRSFFRSFLRSERPLRELLSSDEVWVNARLASFYGLAGSFGESFVAVIDPSGRRGGLLSQSGLLMALSYPHRTSPVRRGKWVLGNLLCQEPSPPPPGVEGLPETEESSTLSLRERMERHRSDPDCASCHESMDPIGFGLEQFNAIGAWRISDASGPIDPAGELPGGQVFAGHEELAAIVADEPAFSYCVTRQLYTYALGRGPSNGDDLILRGVQRDYESAGGSLADLAVAITRSSTFRTRIVDGRTP
jgi:hypothetical protein